MPLLLRYLINEGIEVDESLENGGKKSVEVIVRDINFFPEGVKVSFELRDLDGNIHDLKLVEGERYKVTPQCTLYVPKNPLRGKEVSLEFFAPKAVEFGERRIYPL